MLTKKRIFLLWLPLAGMWFLIGVEQPAITSLIARLADAKTQLAAFGVAFSFYLIVMSPTMQLLTAATALATDKGSYRKLLGFTLLLCVVMTILHLLFGFTQAFEFFCTRIFRIPIEVVEPARKAFLVMTPFVIFVGFRRLWQGVLIRYGKTHIVAIAMVARVVTVVIVLIGGVWLTSLEGAMLGGIALTTGAGSAVLATYLSVRRVLKAMPQKPPDGGPPPFLARPQLLLSSVGAYGRGQPRRAAALYIRNSPFVRLPRIPRCLAGARSLSYDVRFYCFFLSGYRCGVVSGQAGVQSTKGIFKASGGFIFGGFTFDGASSPLRNMVPGRGRAFAGPCGTHKIANDHSFRDPRLDDICLLVPRSSDSEKKDCSCHSGCRDLPKRSCNNAFPRCQDSADFRCVDRRYCVAGRVGSGITLSS
jgi:hypothetical protein